MPELPEVETTRRGLAPLLLGRRVIAVTVREARLRWPVTPALSQMLPEQVFRSVQRRAKYLLLGTDAGTVIAHLGMSGSLRVVSGNIPPAPHEHVDIAMDDGRVLRLRDPRRFGAMLWDTGDPLLHPLLRSLGPEPLSGGFHAGHLADAARGRRSAVKNLIMDAHVVAGVGNIYASEALFLAGIHPARAAGRISAVRYQGLVQSIRNVLAAAIDAGGTTLRDFLNSDGEPGYFAQRLHVYGRAGQACGNCGGPIAQRVIGQRSSFFCPRCQR